MKCNLSSIAEYAKGKIPVDLLTVKNYISTENMPPNRGGVVNASSLPFVAKTQSYIVNDILVSNIRPYFKKIWFARENGGCVPLVG